MPSMPDATIVAFTDVDAEFLCMAFSFIQVHSRCMEACITAVYPGLEINAEFIRKHSRVLMMRVSGAFNLPLVPVEGLDND